MERRRHADVRAIDDDKLFDSTERAHGGVPAYAGILRLQTHTPRRVVVGWSAGDTPTYALLYLAPYWA